MKKKPPMKKTIILLLLGLTWIAPAPAISADHMTLECQIVSETPAPKRSEVPTVKIMLDVMSGDRIATKLYVTHVLANGKRYDRSDQYVDIKMREIEKEMDWKIWWTGRSKKDPSMAMVGTLIDMSPDMNDAPFNGYYTEAQWRGDRLMSVMVANCQTERSTR